MLIRVLGSLSLAALCTASLVQIVRPSVPRLLYNPSPSAPIGWYRLRPDTYAHRGDLVAALAPKSGAALALERDYLPPNIPLIKTVWAVSGEQICHVDGQVLVQGRPALIVLKHDVLGRALPTRSGCYQLSKDEVFLISNDVQTSFDSRYFGPVRRENLLGRVEYMGKLKGRSERRRAGRG
jgi:conjugative transfer signal peptidase TraF